MIIEVKYDFAYNLKNEGKSKSLELCVTRSEDKRQSNGHRHISVPL